MGGADGRRVLRTYLVNQTVHWFIVGLTFPVLVLLLMEKGLDIAQAGMAMAAYSATIILLELPTGGLADSIGRKRTYLVAIAIQMAGGLALLLSFDLLTVVAATVVMGTARAFSSGSMEAWFVDEYKRAEPDGNLQRALARAGVFIPLGLGLGSLVGGVIPSLSGAWAGVLPLGTYDMNLVLMEGMMVVQLILTLALVQEDLAGRSGSIRAGLGRFPEVLSTSFQHGVRNRTVLVLLLASLLFGVALSSIELLWQPRVSDLLGTTELTWVLGVLAAGYFISASAGSMLSPRACSLFRNRYPWVIFATRLLTGALLLLLAFQDTILGFTLFYFLILMTEGVADSPDATLYNAELPSRVRSTMMSFKSLVLQTGGLIGSLSMGYLAGAYSIGSAWMVASAILGGSSVFYAYLALKSARTPVPGPSEVLKAS